MNLLTTILPNIFWIFGLALILATLSYLHWRARLEKKRIKDYFKNTSLQQLLWRGLTLISLSLWLLATTWWERIIWSIYLVLFLFYTWRTKV